ncbi:MAG: hypothetical protein NTY09_03185, partial [bacterium]|nr:hypothetical protein [bacterium]
AIVERHEIALPEWLPSGFKMVGGRRLMNFDQPAIGGDYMPGMGLGQMPEMGPGGGGPPGVGGPDVEGPGGGRFDPGQFRDQGGHFQTVYSDGLNTISIVQLPPGRLGEGLRDPSRAEGILDSKADEVWRLFHTGMAGVFIPNAVVLVFGEVSPDVARQIADSIPVDPIVPPDQLNPDNLFPPGSDQGFPNPGFGGPPSDRPFGGGMGRGHRSDGGSEENPPADQGSE